MLKFYGIVFAIKGELQKINVLLSSLLALVSTYSNLNAYRFREMAKYQAVKLMITFI